MHLNWSRKRFIILAAIGLVACKPASPSYSVTDPKTGETTKISVEEHRGNKTITINSDTGNSRVSMTTAGDVPKELPAHVPPYPGAIYESSFVSDTKDTARERGVSGGMVSFKTPDGPDAVLAFYSEAFTRAGLKDGASGDMGGMKMISFTKGGDNDQGVQVTASQASTGQTNVQIMYSVEK
jgi:hypothetical protein